MKYFLATLDETNGDYEYTHTRAIQAKTIYEATAANEAYASDFYCGYMEEEDGGYMFDCGIVFVSAGTVKEISESTYNEIKGML